MNHIATSSPDKRGGSFPGSRKFGARGRLFAHRTGAFIIAASVFVMAFTTLGTLGMLLTGVFLHQIDMPGYVIWTAVTGVGLLVSIGTGRMARTVWKYETGLPEPDPQPGSPAAESRIGPKAARRTSPAA